MTNLAWRTTDAEIAKWSVEMNQVSQFRWEDVSLGKTNNPEYNKDEYKPLAELISSIGANAGLVPLSERDQPDESAVSTQRLIDQVDELKARIAIPPTSKAGISLSAGNIQLIKAVSLVWPDASVKDQSMKGYRALLKHCAPSSVAQFQTRGYDHKYMEMRVASEATSTTGNFLKQHLLPFTVYLVKQFLQPTHPLHDAFLAAIRQKSLPGLAVFFYTKFHKSIMLNALRPYQKVINLVWLFHSEEPDNHTNFNVDPFSSAPTAAELANLKKDVSIYLRRLVAQTMAHIFVAVIQHDMNQEEWGIVENTFKNARSSASINKLNIPNMEMWPLSANAEVRTRAAQPQSLALFVDTDFPQDLEFSDEMTETW